MQPLSIERRLSEDDYNAIEAAVMETARGRWFLAEYARRNRNADTQAILSALRRLVESAGFGEKQDDITSGMADIARAIAAVEPHGQEGGPGVAQENQERHDAGAFPVAEAETPAAGPPSDALLGSHTAAGSAAVEEAAVETEMHSPLVSFLDEEPQEETTCVFTAPLRLEPQEASEEEELEALLAEEWLPVAGSTAKGDEILRQRFEAERADDGASVAENSDAGFVQLGQAAAKPPAGMPVAERPKPPQPVTLADIEAMSFARKAALFS